MYANLGMAWDVASVAVGRREQKEKEQSPSEKDSEPPVSRGREASEVESTGRQAGAIILTYHCGTTPVRRHDGDTQCVPRCVRLLP